MKSAKRKRFLRRRRHVRKKVSGDGDCPRLSVFRSQRHIYCQLVDDSAGKTLAAASSMSRDLKADLSKGGDVAAARAVGERIAGKAKAIGIRKAVFDRSGYKFHGRVKAVAEGAKKAGLQI